MANSELFSQRLRADRDSFASNRIIDYNRAATPGVKSVKENN
jgi:hypothetical protein